MSLSDAFKKQVAMNILNEIFRWEKAHNCGTEGKQ